MTLRCAIVDDEPLARQRIRDLLAEETDASVVALNVTGILPTVDAYITAFPCGSMPPTSSLNPAAGRVTPNLVMAQVSPAGTVCFFVNTDIDVGELGNHVD
jgi:hypothetical protein